MAKYTSLLEKDKSMTLREEVLSHSGILNESDEDILSSLKNFRKDLERHELAEKFEADAVNAIIDGKKELLPFLISKAKQWDYYLGGIIELIKKEQNLLSEKIEEAKKETNK